MLDKSGLVRARLLSAACAFVIVPVRYTAELMKAVVHIILGGFCGSFLSRVSQENLICNDTPEAPNQHAAKPAEFTIFAGSNKGRPFSSLWSS